jgi:hypothetical protein
MTSARRPISTKNLRGSSCFRSRKNSASTMPHRPAAGNQRSRGARARRRPSMATRHRPANSATRLQTCPTSWASSRRVRCVRSPVAFDDRLCMADIGGKRTFNTIFSKVKQKVQEFDQSRCVSLYRAIAPDTDQCRREQRPAGPRSERIRRGRAAGLGRSAAGT